MANPTCTRDTLISSAPCLDGLDSHNQQARKVWFMAKQLAAILGTDYTAAIGTLNTDANTLTCGMQPGDLDAAALVIELNNAVSAGASVNTDKDLLAADVKCLVNYDTKRLRDMELLLRCKLGRAKAYTQ